LKNTMDGTVFDYAEAWQEYEETDVRRSFALVRDRYFVVADRLDSDHDAVRSHAWRVHGFAGYGSGGSYEVSGQTAWFERDDSNNRIKVRLKSGTSAAMATDYWGYITYTGMSSPTFWVKHNYDGTVTNVSNEWSGYDYPDESPNITKDTYRQITANGSSGGKQFFWVAKRITYSNMARARVVNDDVTFTVKIVSGGVDYTASMPAKNVVLEAKKGEEL